MNVQETIDFIESNGKFGIRLGLESIGLLLSELGNPQDKLKCIHVAGTNGKGSVSTMLSTILKTAGYTTGLYTSPALETFNERVQLNNVPIPDDDLMQVTKKFRPPATRWWQRVSRTPLASRSKPPWPLNIFMKKEPISAWLRLAWVAGWTPPTSFPLPRPLSL